MVLLGNANVEVSHGDSTDAIEIHIEAYLITLSDMLQCGLMTVRKLPRRFSFHWGKGMVKEEASMRTPYHEPTIQLLQYDSGERAVRFCSYEGRRFNRFPLIVGEEYLGALGRAVRKNRELRMLLKRLVE